MTCRPMGNPPSVWLQGTLMAGCSLMLQGSVKAMCSIARCGSLVGLAHSAGNADTGATGEITKSNGWHAATAASRSAANWL